MGANPLKYVPWDKLAKGVMSEWGERLGRKTFDAGIPRGVAENVLSSKNGMGEFDVNIFEKAIDQDPEVREPLAALLNLAGDGNEDAFQSLAKIGEIFEGMDSITRVQNKTTNNISKSQALNERLQLPNLREARINSLTSALEEKKTLWKEKYQTSKGMAQPLTLAGQRAGESVEIPLAAGNRDEMLKDLTEFIRSNEEIGRVSGNDGLVKQPKKGWQAVFGNVIDEKGFPMRLDGGRATSRGPAKFTSMSDNIRRNWKENIYIPDENPKRKAKIRAAAKAQGIEVQKHHVVPIEQTAPFGFLNNGKPRTAADMQVMEDIVKRETGIDLGNKDWNEVYPTKAGHMGASDDPVSSAFGIHRLLDNVTDLQGFRDWRYTASEIKFEMPMRSNQKNPTVKWFKNQDGIIYEAPKGEVRGKAIGDLNDFEAKYPGAKATNFRMGGAPGTYNLTKGKTGQYFAQKHGFSNELLATISRIEDPEIAAQALVLFLKDSGAADTMEAAAALAFRIVDQGVSEDEITKAIAKRHAPQMIELAKYLLYGDDPMYKGNPILRGVIVAEESALGLTKKLGV